MWVGVTAGPFALLGLWLFASPVQAHLRQSIFSDQELTYLGTGWKTVDSQICGQISHSMHTTSTTGDSVSFRFKGTGVIVRGPVTSRSIPLVITVDGIVQPLAAPKNCTNECGILYVDGNLTNEPHIVQVGYTAITGTANLSICGISLFANGQSPFLIPIGSTPGDYGDIDDPQDSWEAKLSLGMLVGITVAIIGTVLLMLAVLVSCVVIRRRISRNVARRRDQKNSCGKYFRNLGGKPDGLSDMQSGDSSSFKESLSGCVIIASASTSVRHTSHLSMLSPACPGSDSNRPISSTSPTLVQANNYHPPSFIRQFASPTFVPDIPSESDDLFLLPSPRSGRSLLRCSIPIGIYSSKSPRHSAAVENPFESPRSSLRFPTTEVRNSVVTEQASSINSSVPNHILGRNSQISIDSTHSGGVTEK